MGPVLTRPDGIGARWRAAFARPTESVEIYLVPGEEVIHVDAPAFKAFVIEELPLILLMTIAAAGAVLWGLESEHVTVAGIAVLAMVAFLVYLRAKRLSQEYTAYILTTARVMKVSGFLSRSAAWIPWVKVTDVRFEASVMGRLLGYATVYIDSANETSGLAEMKNLCDPRAFYLKLTELVQLKQGPMPAAQSLQLYE
jgi:membrane protein YdbS with pleckstrin-like domain